MVAQLVKKRFHKRLPLTVNQHQMNPLKTTIRMLKLMSDISVTAAIKQLTDPDYAVTISLAVTLLLAYFTATDHKCTVLHGK